MTRFFFLAFLPGVLWPLTATGQPASIPFQNASFEAVLRGAPAEWTDCSPEGKMPVGAQPTAEGGVTLTAADGKIFAAMILRDDGSWQAISQPLSQPLRGGQCYRLQLQVARCEPFLRMGPGKKKEVNYVTPAILRIWGGSRSCDRERLLAESGPVVNTAWETLTLLLRPKTTYSHLLLEVYYAPLSDGFYNGNLMIDDLQPLEPVDCTAPKASPEEVSAATPATAASPTALPLPSDRAGLKSFLRTNGATLRFQLEQPVPLRDYFEDENGREIHRNRSLYLAVRALRAFPDETLVIALDPKEHPAKLRLLFDAMEYELGRLNAPENIQVERYKGGDADEDWLWPRETNALFRMRLLNEDE